LQFGGCNSTVDGLSNAAVVVNLERRQTCHSNLVNWMCAIGPRQGDGSCARPTATPTPAPMKVPGQVDLSVHATWMEIGLGKCTTPGLIAEAQADPSAGGPSTRSACRNICVQALARTQILTDGSSASNGPGCRGFAYNSLEGPAQCIIYKSPDTDITSSDTANAGGWTCWSIKAVQGSFDHEAPALKVSHSTPPPVKIEKLNLFQGYSILPSSAVLKRLAPPRQNPDCYAGVDWYTLEDEADVPSTVCVAAKDWALMRNLVPSAERPCSGIRAPGSLATDRVCVDACGYDARLRT